MATCFVDFRETLTFGYSRMIFSESIHRFVIDFNEFLDFLVILLCFSSYFLFVYFFVYVGIVE